jgi:hypothetical protein
VLIGVAMSSVVVVGGIGRGVYVFGVERERERERECVCVCDIPSVCVRHVTQ